MFYFPAFFSVVIFKQIVKGAVCRIELGIAVQIQNIGDGRMPD